MKVFKQAVRTIPLDQIEDVLKDTQITHIIWENIRWPDQRGRPDRRGHTGHPDMQTGVTVNITNYPR